MKKKIGMILILGIVCLMYINSKYGHIKVIGDVILSAIGLPSILYYLFMVRMRF